MSNYGFNKIVGNSIMVRVIKRALKNNSFPQFSVFSGPYGTGKSTNAKNVALALTCEHPVDGEPCLQCATCGANLRAFATTGEALNVKIINLGKFLKKDDVTDLIRDVFVLQSGLRNKVYVFEEAHALASIPGAQVAHLEEIDRMPPNTYVIMCTTDESSLDDALRSRAIHMTFGRLSVPESELLVQQVLTEKGIEPAAFNSTIKSLIVDNARGIPREIIKALEFVLENAVTEEELLALFHKISAASMIELFQSMQYAEMTAMVEALNTMLHEHSVSDIVTAIKDFFVRVLFITESKESREGFSAAEYLQVLELFPDAEEVYKIAPILERLNKTSSEANLKMALFNVRLVIQNRKLSEVIAGSPRIATAEVLASKTVARELTAFTAENDNSKKLTKLTTGAVNSFFGGAQ